MANPLNFKDEFDSLATGGCIGAPHGDLAYCYMRVSSSGQADEGRSGLPRQLRNIHEAALKNGFRISWDMVFADDHSGFEFNGRPELTRLRKEFTSRNRRANVVIMEYLDRLSRNADWHQGFLLDEMKRFDITPVFWKSFNSRIERAVMGAISQDGMEQAKQRMAEGNLHKARDGRVTARTPAFGYKLVDSQGRTGETAKKDTHYAIYPDEAVVVKYIFERVGIDGATLYTVCRELQRKYPPPKKMSDWEVCLVRNIVRNTVYKGEFISHRMEEYKAPRPDPEGVLIGPPQYYKKRRERPKEEWIIVPVPAIVTPGLWEKANKTLEMNKRMAPRNGKAKYLLTGLVKCATCGSNFIGRKKIHRKDTRNGHKEYLSFYYACPTKNTRMPVARARLNCNQSQISASIIEGVVWSAVYKILLNPDLLIRAMDSEYYGEGNARLKSEIMYLESKIQEKDEDDKALWRAYRAEVFNEDEYAARRNDLKEEKAQLQIELEDKRSQLMSPEEYEERKQYILSVSKEARDSGLTEDAPFETKRRIIKLIVDKIIANPNEGWVRIEGKLRGKYRLGGRSESGDPVGGDDKPSGGGNGGAIVNNPTGRDSSQRPFGSWQEKSGSLEPWRW